jgi:histidine triad (HIT) family protein
MPDNCIICRIISGELPSAKLHEDDKTFAFLDLHPVREGHALVVPKVHSTDYVDMASVDYQATMECAQKLAKAIQRALGVPRVGLLIKGFDIPHVHIHLIPMDDPHELISGRHGKAQPPQATLEERMATAHKIMSAAV